MKTIADVGCNYITLEDCLLAVKFAKKDGIDYIKFQHYTHCKLYGISGQMKGQLSKSWIRKIHEECKRQDIGFACSVFHPDDVEFLDEFVDFHKIASAEAEWKKLINACMDTGKETLVSLGCIEDVEAYLDHCSHGIIRLTPMACHAQYPSYQMPVEQLLDLYSCPTLDEYGLSCHSLPGIYYQYELAHRFGCRYFEFHYNPHKFETPDSRHSISHFVKPTIKPFEANRNIVRQKTPNGYYRVKK